MGILPNSPSKEVRMKRTIVVFVALFSVLATAPAWAVLDISLNAEYVTGGEAKLTSNIPLLPGGSSDLKGGTLLGTQFSILGLTVGFDAYTDELKDGGNAINELAIKAGYGFGFPGFDVTALAAYEVWRIASLGTGGEDLILNDIVLGLHGVITMTPVVDIEAWYNQSVTSNVGGEVGDSLSGLDGAGTGYGVRLIYDLALGFGVSAGYRFEEHEVSYSGLSAKLTNSGYILGVNWTF
jgi:hypothetical protein